MSPRPGPRARHSVKDLSHHAGRTAMVVVLAVVLFVVSFVAIAYHDLQSQVTRVDVASMIGTARPTRSDEAKVSDDYAGVAVNILVLGSDTRDGANNVDGAAGSDDVAGARSDTAMIMHVSADRSRIEVVSIPRDTLLEIPSCTRADGTTTYAQSSAMFNSAFAGGAGEGTTAEDVAAGAACTLKTVEELTGIHIDEFVVVDFAGLQRMVDALDGVTVYVSDDISDAEHTGLVLDAGCYHFDGATALQYARARYGAGDGSDLSRIERQQNLMGAMLRAAQSKSLLSNADDLYSFARSALSTLTTSPRIGSLPTLAGLAQSLQAIGMDNVSFITMPNTLVGARVVPTAEAEDVWSALINDVPVGSENVSLQGTGTTSSATEADVQDGTTTDAAGAGADGAQEPAQSTGTTVNEAAPEPAEDPAAQCYASGS
ncbi:LCP family protein [Actinomyces faecalis]|uniref:LCP family protein n=1 Tax=Actinomyces faecalis TaxID=2722820 RepID=UPI002E2A6560|nr:LCP family protein [Actinomyces faecalis]